MKTIGRHASIENLLNDLAVRISKKNAQDNVALVQGLIRQLPHELLQTVNYKKNTTLVERGELLASPLRKSNLYNYADVPLGLILEGEVVVIENGKGVKRLAAGDFIGLFETAYYYRTTHPKKIGNWSLIADSKVRILFIGDMAATTKLRSKIAPYTTKLVELARQDSVPQPITDLPLLDVISGHYSLPLLDDAIIIAHTHLVPSNAALFRHLASLVGYHKLFILEKPYSTIATVHHQLIQSGVDVVPVTLVEKMPYDFAVPRSLEVLWAKVTTAAKIYGSKRLFVLDDGADVLLSVPWEQLRGMTVAGVEQTQRGVDRLKNTSKTIPSTINAGESKVKKEVEAEFIAEGVIKKLLSLSLLRNKQAIGVVGTGSIGENISAKLQAAGHDVTEYDIRNHQAKRGNKRSVTSLDTIMQNSDIIIGCTGTNFLQGVVLDRVKGSKVCVSASSGDVEFYALLNMAGFPNSDYRDVTCQPHQDLNIHILNGGYPINFDRQAEQEPKEEMQVTRSLMYCGLFQAVNLFNTADRGLHNLDTAMQRSIMKEWARL